jgi:hypothetical protein
VASSDLDLPVAQKAEPTFSHAASSRTVEHKITSDTHKVACAGSGACLGSGGADVAAAIAPGSVSALVAVIS